MSHEIHPRTTSIAAREHSGATGRSSHSGDPPNAEIECLLIDDDPKSAERIEGLLGAVPGFRIRVRTPTNLSEGLSLLDEFPFDLVLVNARSSGIAGPEGLQRLVVAAASAATIVTVPDEEDGLGLQAISLGAMDHLVIPGLTAELLSRSIRYAVERKRWEAVDHLVEEATAFLGQVRDLPLMLVDLCDLCTRNLADFCQADFVRSDGTVESTISSRAVAVDQSMLDRLKDLEIPEVSDAQVVLLPLNDEDTPEWLTEEASREAIRGLGIQACLSIRVRRGDDWKATLRLFSSRGAFGPQEIRLANRLAAIIDDAVGRAYLFERFARALDTRDRVLGIVAHDLRNPVHNIGMATEMLLDDEIVKGRAEHPIGLIRRSAALMNRLIEDLLDIARIEEGVLTVVADHGSASALVKDAVISASAIASSANVRITSHIDVRSPALIDHDRMLQVLANIIGNAIKFTPRGGTIEVAVRDSSRGIRFSVRDGGPGISPEDARNLFQPFWQGSGPKGTGTGLGLSIAQGIVAAHNGRIWVESERGGPATFYVEVPKATERSAAFRPVATTTRITAPTQRRI